MDVASLVVSVRATGVDQTAAQLGKVDAAGRRAGAGVGAFKSTLKGIGAGVGIASVAAGLTQATKTVVGFDKSMRNVNSIARLTESRFQGLRKDVLALGGKTAQAPSTLADGLYDLVSSGFDAKQSLQILESSAVAATAGLTTTEVATKAVAAVLNAYKRPAGDAAAVSDTLFQTVNKGVLTFEDLAQNIGDVLPFASSLKVGLAEVGGAVATMTKAGVSAPETMTRIKGAMVALIKPTDELKDVYGKLGVATGGELIRKTGSFQSALQAIARESGFSKEKLAELFPDIRGLGGALLLTGDNAKAAAADLRDVGDASGAASKTFEEQSKSVAVQWNKTKALLASSVIKAGDLILPSAIGALEDLNEVLEGLSQRGTLAGLKSGLAGDASEILQTVDKLIGGYENFINVLGEVGRAGSLLPDFLGGGQFEALKRGSDIASRNINQLREDIQVIAGTRIRVDADTKGALDRMRELAGTKLGDKVVRVLGKDDDAKSKIKKLIALGIPKKDAKVIAQGVPEAQAAIDSIKGKTVAVQVKWNIPPGPSGALPGTTGRDRSTGGSGRPKSNAPSGPRAPNAPTNPSATPNRKGTSAKTSSVQDTVGSSEDEVMAGVSAKRDDGPVSQMQIAVNPFTGKRERHTAAQWIKIRANWKNRKARADARKRKAQDRRRDVQQNPLTLIGIDRAEVNVTKGDDGLEAISEAEEKALTALQTARRKRLAAVVKALKKGKLTRANRRRLLGEQRDLISEIAQTTRDLTASPEPVDPFDAPFLGAQAAVTAAQVNTPDDKGDDVGATQGALTVATTAYNAAVAAGDSAGVIKWGGEIMSLREAIKTLTTATEDQTAAITLQLDLTKQQLDEVRLKSNTQAGEIRALEQWITGVASGGIGQRVGSNLSTPTPTRWSDY